MFSFRGVRWRGWQDRIGPFRNNWRPPRSNSFWAEKSGRWLPGSLSSRRDSFSWKRGFHILANRGISLVTDTETRNIPTTRVTSVLATPSFFLPPSFSIFSYFGSFLLGSFGRRRNFYAIHSSLACVAFNDIPCRGTYKRFSKVRDEGRAVNSCVWDSWERKARQ